MGQYVAPLRDMQFVLHEFLNVTEEFKNLPAYQEIDADIINQVLAEGAKFTQEVLFPLNHTGDREGCHYDAATKAVTTPKGFKEAYKQYVEGGDGIFTIRGSGNCRSWNNIQYKPGLSAKNVGARKLSMNVATIPPGGVAYAHIHVGFEVILYIAEGKVRHEFGDGCKKVLENEAGDFIYIKPGVPHEVVNMSDTEPVVAFVARSSADEWDNIVAYDRNEHS